MILVIVTAGLAACAAIASAAEPSSPLDVGGELRPGLAAYDVLRYELELEVDIESQTLAGSVTFMVKVLEPIMVFECDLVDQLSVDAVRLGTQQLEHAHDRGIVTAQLTEPWSPGEIKAVTVDYHGPPVVADKPKGFGGFVWARTPESDEPWIGVSCQLEGADLWWPCKEHPSDEPDQGMSITITCPAGLQCLTNGRLVESRPGPDGTRIETWKVSYPINTYLVTLSIGPYVPLVERYHGIDGRLDEELVFWALPEHREQATETWRQISGILEVLGKRFGEYPFFEDKLWVVETPYQGMEHQSLIAYGDPFTNNDFGFDGLLLHELAHEWWGNMISVDDWADFWIHESIGTYAEAIYVNDTQGLEAYLAYMRSLRPKVESKAPLVQGDNLPGSIAYTNDIYFKGAWVLHTLRYLISDGPFFRAIKRCSTDPEHMHGFITTEDLLEAFEQEAGQDLDWFWQRYLYKNELPAWSVARRPEGAQDRVTISWNDPYFSLPFPVLIDEIEQRLTTEDGSASVLVENDAELIIDPSGWLLVREPQEIDG